MISPTRTHASQIRNVRKSGLRGSPVPWKGRRIGMRLSEASACITRLADWIEASAEEVVEAITPIMTITEGPVCEDPAANCFTPDADPSLAFTGRASARNLLQDPPGHGAKAAAVGFNDKEEEMKPFSCNLPKCSNTGASNPRRILKLTACQTQPEKR